MGPFLAGDDPHPGRPPGQVQQTGQLGDPRPGTDLALGVVGRCPHLVGDLLDHLTGVAGQGEPDRVLHPLTGEPVQQLVGAAGTIDPDQNPLARTAASHVAG